MSYLVLARKSRPQAFEEVVGQKPVVITLQNSLKRNRVAHAILFSGVRGVGKTSRGGNPLGARPAAQPVALGVPHRAYGDSTMPGVLGQLLGPAP